MFVKSHLYALIALCHLSAVHPYLSISKEKGLNYTHQFLTILQRDGTPFDLGMFELNKISYHTFNNSLAKYIKYHRHKQMKNAVRTCGCKSE